MVGGECGAVTRRWKLFSRPVVVRQENRNTTASWRRGASSIRHSCTLRPPCRASDVQAAIRCERARIRARVLSSCRSSVDAMTPEAVRQSCGCLYPRRSSALRMVLLLIGLRRVLLARKVPDLLVARQVVKSVGAVPTLPLLAGRDEHDVRSVLLPLPCGFMRSFGIVPASPRRGRSRSTAPLEGSAGADERVARVSLSASRVA